MTAEVPVELPSRDTKSLATAGWFKYGMLSFILVLALLNIGVYANSPPAARSGAVGNLVVGAMLLVNHVTNSFLHDPWRRRMIIPQFVLIGLGSLYILNMMRN